MSSIGAKEIAESVRGWVKRICQRVAICLPRAPVYTATLRKVMSITPLPAAARSASVMRRCMGVVTTGVPVACADTRMMKEPSSLTPAGRSMCTW